MAGRVRQRLCKFIPQWLFFDQFSSWLTPVKDDDHKAYCRLCDRVFAVSHGGLSDVKAHYRGKRHISLQRQLELQTGDRLRHPSKQQDRDYSVSKKLIFGDKSYFDGHIFNPGGILNQDDFEEEEASHSQKRGHSPGNFASESDMNFQAKMLPQQYCLRWKYHHNNLQVMFSQLLERESFCDVTLACEGKTLRAHKVVLSACSTYFDAIFSQYEESNPIVILKDVKFTDIKALVEFMYKGEINIDHSHLASLLKTAEDLRIKGLAEVSWRTDEYHQDGPPDPQISKVESLANGAGPPELHEPPTKKRRRPSVENIMPDVPEPQDETFMDDPGEEFPPDDEDSDNDVTVWGEVDEGRMQTQEGDSDPSTPKAQNYPTLVSQLADSSACKDSPGEAGEVDKSTAEAAAQRLAEQFPDVIKMNDYLATGRRPQFWEEPFTRRVMEAIKAKELEMKTGAELLGVSYGTLYGRYRDVYGCLKHPYRVRDFWTESGPADILAKVQRKELTLFRAAEMLNVTMTTLANYLSTLRRCGSDEEPEDDEKLAALENNPDITIVKPEKPSPTANMLATNTLAANHYRPPESEDDEEDSDSSHNDDTDSQGPANGLADK